MDTATGELGLLLKRVAKRHVPDVPIPVLEGMTRARFGDRLDSVLSGASVYEFTIAVVFLAASSGRGPSVASKYQGRAYPLIAAKHLLGLGEYPTEGIVPQTERPLGAFRKHGKQLLVAEDIAGPGALQIRKNIAAEAGGFGTSRNLDPGKRGAEIAAALLTAFEVALQFEDITDRIGSDLGRIVQLRKTHLGVAAGKPSSPVRPPKTSNDRIRSRKRLWRGLVGAGSVVVVVLVAVLTTTLLAQRADWATDIRTYIPSTNAIETLNLDDRADELKVVCAESSLTTLRKDAHLCVIAQLVLDPCFELPDPQYVVCPRPTGEGVIFDFDVYKVGEVEESWFDAKQAAKLIGVGEADQQAYPWAIELQEKDESGRNFVCIQALTDARFSYAYSCATDRMPVRISSADSMKDHGKWITVASEGALTASTLKRDGDKITIRLGDEDAGNLRTVNVLTVWY